MQSSVCFETIDMDQEQTISGGAAVKASLAAGTLALGDIIAFSPERGGGGPGGTFLGAVARAAAIAGLVGTYSVLTATTGGTVAVLTASASDPG